MHLRALGLLALALGLTTACRGRASAPSCGAVGAQFLVLAHGELVGARPAPAPATQRAMADQLPAMRDSLVHACTDTHWSDDVRRCLSAARTAAAFEACQTQLTDDQRRSLGSQNSW